MTDLATRLEAEAAEHERWEPSDSLIALLREAATAVRRLPLSGSGTRILPGDMLWHYFRCPPGAALVEVADVSNDQCICTIDWGESSGWSDVMDPCELYSTREAAEAARGKA